MAIYKESIVNSIGLSLNKGSESPSLQLNRLFKMAVTAGVESAVKMHIRRGDDLNARDDQGLTPLMIAASRNKPQICKLLIDSGVIVNLTSPSGLDALQIAIQVGSKECEYLIRATKEKVSSPDPSQKKNSEQLFDFSEYVIDLGISGSKWEPEVTPTAPDLDEGIIAAALKRNEEISEFKPIDSYEDWKDFEAYLPDKSADFSKEINEDSNLRLRILLSMAIVDGRIPSSLFNEVTTPTDQTQNSSLANAIEFTLSDIGAQIDESIDLDEPFSEEKMVDEIVDEVSDAIEFMSNLLSARNNSMSHYYREASKFKLINGDEEIYLSQQMEACLEEAIDMLSSWPQGIKYLSSSVELLRSGLIKLESITTVRSIDSSLLKYEFEADSESDNFSLQRDITEVESDGEILSDEFGHSSAVTEFLSYFDSIKDLISRVGFDETSNLQNASLLKKLSLSRVLLLELSSKVNDLDSQTSKKECFSNIMIRHELARNKMIQSNFRLVSSIAMRYSNFGLNLEDLIQEGNIGLMKAVDRYDWRLGFKLSTYATWWIKQSVTRAIGDKAKTIRVPAHACEMLNRIIKLIDTVEGKSGKTPKLNMIGSQLNIQPKKIEHLIQFINEPLSLDDLESEEINESELFEDKNSPDPFLTVAINNLHETFERLFADLEPNQEKIIRLRFGFDNRDPITLEEIGEQFGVTRERIRQIEAKAIKKMSTEIRMQILEPFLDLDFSKAKQRIYRNA